MREQPRWIVLRLLLVCAWCTSTATSGDTLEPEKRRPAKGPLRVHPENGRYFTDGSRAADGGLKAVYLTGSHTWANLIDRGPSDTPPVFDFDGYLDFLERHNHNFIRLWCRHVTWYHGYGEGELHAGPLSWARTGSEKALDGKPRFDLAQFHAPYFERLWQRVTAAKDRGLYVGVMLFGGNYECRGGWRGNPFHAANNINGINGDPDALEHGLKSHTLQIPEVVRLQEQYVRKVIDTLNDLDNVLYEISNEGHGSSAEWQKHWIAFIGKYQATKRKQHPVGMTALYVDDPKESDAAVYGSAADWVSPLTDANGVRKIGAATGAKVSLVDSDHWFVKELYKNAAFGREWVWKAFCRGHNPILMEHLPPLSFVDPTYPLTIEDEGYAAARRAMGHTRTFAERMNLARMQPRNEAASTGFCISDPGKEYLVFKPVGEGEISVELKEGTYKMEWFDPVNGKSTAGEQFKTPNGARKFEPPFATEAVLYLKSIANRQP